MTGCVTAQLADDYDPVEIPGVLLARFPGSSWLTTRPRWRAHDGLRSTGSCLMCSGGGGCVPSRSPTPATRSGWSQRAPARVTGRPPIVDAPWDVELMYRGGDPVYRQVVFGQDFGLLPFPVDDGTELIRIFGIVWIG
jgi:hypothetical protein